MAILYAILDLLKQVGTIFIQVLSWLYEKFMELSFFEKAIVICVIPAFFAVVMPMARFRLFEIYFYVNNPLAVYMIGIVFIMFFTHFFAGKVTLLIRVGTNLLYLILTAYLGLAHDIAQTEYTITAGYYLNLAVPFIFIVLSVLSFFERQDY